MISSKKNNIKSTLLIILILILLILIGFSLYYTGYVDVLRNILNGQKTKKNIIDGISINNIDLNYDFNSDTYYFPVNLRNDEKIQLNIKLKTKYNIKSSLEDKEFKDQIDIIEDITYNKILQIDIESFLYNTNCTIKFTNIPSMSLNFNEKEIGNEYIYSEFLITDPNYEENDTKYQYYDDAKVRYRGGSTAAYQKKSYRVKLEKDIDFGLLGMKVSKTWILDSLVTDSSCLRTKIASDIWNVINEDLDEKKYANLNAKYIELYVNGEYAGLYLLKETVDEDLLNLDRDKGVLLKGVNWNKIDFDNYDKVKDELFGPFEIKYPDNPKDYPQAWKNILDKLKQYYSGYTSYDVMEKTFYKENIVNHKIFLLITQALDNYEYKNIYYSIVDNNEETKVVLTPWDLDLTFGMLWDNETFNYTEQYDRIEEIVEPFGIVSDEKTAQCYKERWEFLSETVLSKENINDMIDKQYNYLNKADALKRENDKHKHTNLLEEKEEIKNWYSNRFEVIDRYIKML